MTAVRRRGEISSKRRLPEFAHVCTARARFALASADRSDDPAKSPEGPVRGAPTLRVTSSGTNRQGTGVQTRWARKADSEVTGGAS